MDDASKPCKICHRVLPLTAFGTTGTGKWKRGRCRDCCATYQRERLEWLVQVPCEAKMCCQCHVMLSPDHFTKSKNSCDGLQSRCRACSADYSRGRTEFIVRPDSQQCVTCGEVKLASQFASSPTYRVGLKPSCNACWTVLDKVRRYNLTADEYGEMIAGGCRVCGAVENLQVDHDHACCDGEFSCGCCVRGVLCRRHNMALGLFRDDLDEMRAAIEYLDATAVRSR